MIDRKFILKRKDKENKEDNKERIIKRKDKENLQSMSI